MENAEANKKGSPIKLGLIIIAFIVGGLWLLGVMVGEDHPNREITTNTEKTNVSVPNKQTEPQIAEKSYQEVFTFSGNGAKKSEPFTITGGRFKVAYDCKGSICQAFVYSVGSPLPQIVMNTTGATKDETIIYGNGEYYIDANTLGTYTMTVSDYK